MAHVCTFNITPVGYLDSNGKSGDLNLMVRDHTVPFQFNRSKFFQYMSKSTECELDTMEAFEILPWDHMNKIERNSLHKI